MNFLDKLAAQLPFNKKAEKTEYFFALNIDPSQVTSTVWAAFGNEVNILGQATVSFGDQEDLLDKSLQAIDKSLGALEIEPEKVLFGVPDSWSSEDNLKEPYLKLLRRILKECDLTPMAFVTTTNALSFMLQKDEGIPPTVILLGFGDSVQATLIRAGKVTDTRTVPRSDHLSDDIEKTFQEFTDMEVLPAKILIYSQKEGEKLEKIQGELMSYPWMNKFSFLHFPKIEILDEDATSRAIIYSATAELYPEIDLKHHFTKNTPTKTPTISTKHLNLEQSEDNITKGKADLGFVRGDIKEQINQKESEEVEELERKEEEVPVKGRKLSRLRPGETAVEEEDLESDALVAAENNFALDDLAEERYSEETLSLTKKDQLASSLRGHLPFKLPKISGSWGKLLILPAMVVAVLLAYLFLVRATVTIFVEPRILEKETEVVADPKQTSVDEEKKIIPAGTIETNVNGSGKGVATGSKQIGDPAKGKVTVYNMTSNLVSLSSGTVLTSTGGLKFTLDSSVKIASQSSTLVGDGITIKWGKSDPVGVTASVIGPDSNLPASSGDNTTYLLVSGYQKSQVAAAISESLSGGTSKTVTVVTSDDQKKLQAQVLDDLRQKGMDDLKGKLTGDQKIVAEALSIVDGKYNFSKQVGDNASEFSLNASVRFRGTTYVDGDLRTIVSKLVVTDVPVGFQMNLQDSETQADVAKVDKDGKLTFRAKFRAKLLPKFNTDEIKQDIRGKGMVEVADKLKGLENVLGSEIKLNPSFPDNFARMPLLEKNINIIVTPK